MNNHHLSRVSDEIIRSLKPEILKSNGRFLYSPASTLRKGNIYLLGLNPGGNAKLSRGSVLTSIKSLPNQTYCAYTDEEWGRVAGEHRLQKRVKWLFNELGLDIRKVCASNLIFKRSKNSDKLDVERLAKLCWPAHEIILHIVQPRLVIAFGRGPFDCLESLAKNKTETKRFSTGHGNWIHRIFQGEIASLKVTVIGLPHLSRFNIIGKTRAVKWIRKYL
jgi:hypothetical protein